MTLETVAKRTVGSSIGPIPVVSFGITNAIGPAHEAGRGGLIAA